MSQPSETGRRVLPQPATKAGIKPLPSPPKVGKTLMQPPASSEAPAPDLLLFARRQPWFFDVSTEEAAELLMNSPIGTYVIRPSSSPDKLAVSFVGPDEGIRKILIEPVAGGGCRVVEDGATTFRSIIELLASSKRSLVKRNSEAPPAAIPGPPPKTGSGVPSPTPAKAYPPSSTAAIPAETKSPKGQPPKSKTAAPNPVRLPVQQPPAAAARSPSPLAPIEPIRNPSPLAPFASPQPELEDAHMYTEGAFNPSFDFQTPDDILGALAADSSLPEPTATPPKPTVPFPALKRSKSSDRGGAVVKSRPRPVPGPRLSNEDRASSPSPSESPTAPAVTRARSRDLAENRPASLDARPSTPLLLPAEMPKRSEPALGGGYATLPSTLDSPRARPKNQDVEAQRKKPLPPKPPQKSMEEQPRPKQTPAVSLGSEKSAFEKKRAARQSFYEMLVELPEEKPSVPEVDIPVDRRTHIVRELISSDKSYLNSVQNCVKHWCLPLKEMLNSTDKKPLLKEDKLKALFGNIQDIAAVNESLIAQLETNTSLTTGQILVQQLPLIAFVYKPYILGSTVSLTILEDLQKKKTWTAFEATAQQASGGHGLSALLIQPVQRILRYKLLLEDLVKNTPAQHSDLPNLQKALNMVLELADNVNKAKAIEEHSAKLLSIEKSLVGRKGLSLPKMGRTFVREGELTKVCRKSNKKRYFFLCNDILIMASPIKDRSEWGAVGKTIGKEGLGRIGESDQGLYNFHTAFDLRLIWVGALREQKGELETAFQILSSNKSFLVYTETLDEKELWLEDLEALTDSTTARLAAPVWVPDNSTDKCTACGQKFSGFTRRHHCRNCGNVFCKACTAEKRVLVHQAESEKPLRVCVLCVKVLDSSPGLFSGVSADINAEVDDMFNSVDDVRL